MYTQLLADILGRDPRIREVSTAADSASIKHAIQHQKNIDVIVLGSNLDEVPLRGIALLRELRMTCPEIKGVVLLESSKREVILEAFRSGARGLFSRHEPLETLSKCVMQVHEGHVWANNEQMSYAVEALALSPNIKAVDANGLNLLSKREIEVVHSLAEGLTNREIASRLDLSQHTIKNYLFRIFDKLGVSSRMELLFLTLNQNSGLSMSRGIVGKNGKDPEKPSIAWYKKAAEAGSALAQVELARMYSDGDGISANTAMAYMWYTASERSCTEMTAKTSLLKRKLEKQLTSEQILEARKMATEKFPQADPSLVHSEQ